MNFNNSTTFGGKQITIKQIVLVEKEGYQNQWIRPLELDVTYDAMNRIETMLDKKKFNGINNIKAVDITNVLPDTLLFSATPTMSSMIKNGWGTKRGLFMIEAVSPHSSGYGEEVFYIQGFTEHWDVTLSGKISDEMEFYMNTIIVISRTYNPTTKHIHSRVIDNYSIVHHQDDGSINASNNNLFNSSSDTVMLARPDDILVTMSQQAMFDDQHNIAIIPNSTLKLGGVDSEIPSLVKRGVTTPMGHLSATMTGILQAQASSDISYQDGDILEHASTVEATRSGVMEDILFIRKITEQNGLQTTATFTLDTLNHIDPSLTGDKLMIYKKGQSYKNQDFSRIAEDTMSTHAPTEENRIINMIVESFIDYLSSSAITHMLVHMSNRNGQPEINIVDSSSIITNFDVNLMLGKIHTKILTELFPVISRQNLQMLEIMVDMDLIGNTMITISINDGAPETLNIPTAMESLFSSTISDDVSYKNLVHGYKSIADTIIVSGIK